MGGTVLAPGNVGLLSEVGLGWNVFISAIYLEGYTELGKSMH